MLQKYIAKYCPSSTFHHYDLRIDERIVFNSPLGSRNDGRPCRSSCKL